MSASLLYVYGVVPAGLRAASDPPPGIDNGAVDKIPLGEFVALVSSVAAAEYNGEAGVEMADVPGMGGMAGMGGTAGIAELAGDPDWLAPRAVAHDSVVTWASDQGAVVPFPMWVMFENAAGLKRGLAPRAAALRKTLEFVSGAREYGVRVRADAAALQQAAVALDPELALLDAQIRRVPPGQAYLLKRKLDAARKNSVRGVATRIADDVHHALDAVARASALQSGAQNRSNLVTDGAYLVADAGYDSFRAVLTALVERLTPAGCRFEFTGPWPPYHFVAGGNNVGAGA